MPITFTKYCEQCGDIIPPKRFKNQPPHKVLYCSKECGQLSVQQRYDLLNERDPDMVQLNQGTSGVHCRCCIPRRSYHVFRSQSPACPCDLIIMKGDCVQRVEVRTGNINLNGTFSYSKNRLELHEYDILAVVIRGKDVVYTPDID